MTAAALEVTAQEHLADELVHAIRARRVADPLLEPYWGGFIVGFTGSLVTDDVFTDALTDARRVLFAGTYDLDSVVARLALLGRNVEPERAARILKASGVLYGWKRGTEERDDAEECTTCEARILTDTDHDAERCIVGWFCDPDCHQTFDAMRCCAAERREGLL